MLVLGMMGDRPKARQFIERPLVYLDHWAWMDLADNEALGQRFVTGIALKSGTVAWSQLSWLECADVADLDRLGRMEVLMRRLERRLFFIDFYPRVVQERLEAVGEHGDESVILGDTRAFDHYVGHFRSGIDPLDPELYLTYLRSPGVAEVILQARAVLESGWTEAVEAARVLAETDEGRRELLRRSTASRSRFPVWPVYQAALYQATNTGMNASDVRHARDFFHMVVPLASCDLVVLDKNGKERSRQIQSELRGKGTLSLEATVVSTLPDALSWIEAA